MHMHLYQYVKHYQTLVRVLNTTERRGTEQEVHFALKLLYHQSWKICLKLAHPYKVLSKNTNYIQSRQENLTTRWRNENWNLKRPATYYFGFFVRPLFTYSNPLMIILFGRYSVLKSLSLQRELSSLYRL